MKKNIKYFVMAAIALLSMSACTNEMDEQDSANSRELQPVQFQMAMVNTRTVTDATTRTTSWKTGDAIGIFAYNTGTETAIATNAKYVLGSDDSWKAEAGSEIYPETAIDYYAYYPYQEGMTDPTKISLSALVDQSAASCDDYGKSDVLASQSKNVAVGQNTVKLTFKHMFAMVEVKIEGDKVTKQPTKVELKGVKLATTLNLKTAEPAATINQDATAQDITMYYLTNPNAQTNVHSFRAVVPAQTIAASTPLIAIYAPDDAGKTYTMQHPAEVSYNVGVFRQLNVNIGSAKVSLTIPKGDLTIDPWTPSEPIGGEGGEIVGVTTKLDLTTEINSSMTFNELGTWSAKKLNENTDYWFTRKDDKTTIVSFDVTESAIKGANTTLRGAWGTTSFGYHCGAKIFERAQYKLTFQLKSTIIGNGVLGVGIRTSDDLKGFNIADLYKGLRNMAGINIAQGDIDNANNGWKEFSMIVDLSKASATTNMTDQTDFPATTEEEVKGLSIIFFNNLNGASTSYDTFIKDIVFEKVTQ